jgi:calcium-dependent protein kinase
LVMEYIKGK